MRVLITGAASGFGQAVAAALKARGENVRGLDIREAPDVIRADIRDGDQTTAAVERAIEELGGLDILINNAGIGEPTFTGATPNEIVSSIIETNLLGTWRVTAAALPSLLESRGRVVNVSSALAFVNLPFAVAYTASKRGVAAYSDALRLEHGDRIKVTTVYPGYVRTPIHARSEELGLSLGDYVPADPIEGVMGAILRACYSARPRRDVATSFLTRSGIFWARHFPGLSDRVVRYRMAKHMAALVSVPAPGESSPPR